MYLVRIETTFDSGHRLLDYDGKCAYPHGHTYKAEVFLGGNSLDSQGLVFDFTDLKRWVKGWIDDNWDHAFLVNSRDTEMVAALASLTKSRVYQFNRENPSCEVICRTLFNTVAELCGIAPARVRVWESEDQYAEYSQETAPGG